MKLNHVSFIMDGNRRWERASISEKKASGHEMGLLNMMEIIKYCSGKIDEISFFTFSSDNWNRSIKEIYKIMKLASKYSSLLIEECASMNIRCKFIGDLKNLPDFVYEEVIDIERKTKNNTGMKLYIAINYSGRKAILEACKSSFYKHIKSGKSSIDMTESCFSSEVSPFSNDPDICIRTGGGKRISDFLLWNFSYTEFFFEEKLWPDFGIKDFEKIISKCSSIRKNLGS
ncbi:polyprenyl diphosphate synthase [Candidatus Nesciobacter abundans]|nr:polyprenyl diphosphate synthase [Candidatus Nesciobacter abundans]